MQGLEASIGKLAGPVATLILISDFLPLAFNLRGAGEVRNLVVIKGAGRPGQRCRPRLRQAGFAVIMTGNSPARR
jgi:hypothetical protein